MLPLLLLLEPLLPELLLLLEPLLPPPLFEPALPLDFELALPLDFELLPPLDFELPLFEPPELDFAICISPFRRTRTAQP